MMERKIGRRIQKGEVVRLIDGNRQNLDPKNHQLMTRSELARITALRADRRRDHRGRFSK